MIHLMTSLHQQLVNFYLLIITIQFMGISQSLSTSADHFFFSSSEQNPKSKLQRETGKQGGRKRRGSDSKPRYCPPARQHVVTELANTLNQKMQLPCKTKVLAFTSWWQHGVSLLLWKSLSPKLPVAQRHDVISQTRKNNLFFFYWLF